MDLPIKKNSQDDDNNPIKMLDMDFMTNQMIYFRPLMTQMIQLRQLLQLLGCHFWDMGDTNYINTFKKINLFI